MVGDVHARVVSLLADRPPRAGRVKVLAIEGRSGSGKSTLATAVAAELAAPVVRMDDLYAGWDGLLDGVDALVRWILDPLRRGEEARWQRYDWHLGQYAEWHRVPETDTLVVEGTGAGARETAPYLSALVWLDAPDEVRRERALARDGDVYAPHWDRWARHEDAFYSDHDVRARADLLIPGA
ncbi:AAA family ATPase [Phytohabitans aurantiacus]|uniref:Adenylate kinase n=1 Tax=Phytohabitans aurantiacus TaxID=3016789 RepID=A0ABQ5R0U4_9ACTN|nr:AAA family ATPase [Phytohabitans aurantiacus]GLI00188.1 adenylate kinase [Phytohabitans aurantiacus]